MIVILSPSKTIKKGSVQSIQHFTQPAFIKKAEQIVNKLKKTDTEQLQSMLKASTKLTYEAKESFQLWNSQHNTTNSTQSIFAFNGHAFTGMNAREFSNDTLLYSQAHLIILSGLYGALRPLDLIQPYRLDVGNKLTIGQATLYSFWKKKITEFINRQMIANNSQVLINLASQEYFSMLDAKLIKGRIITPVFKDMTSGKYKIVSLFAKKARGKMSRFIFENKIYDPQMLQSYDVDGYFLNHETSTSEIFTFLRG